MQKLVTSYIKPFMCAFLTLQLNEERNWKKRAAKEERNVCAELSIYKRQQKKTTTRGRRWLLSNQKLTSSCNVIYNKVDHDDIVLPSSASTETDIEIHFSYKMLFSINQPVAWWRISNYFMSYWYSSYFFFFRSLNLEALT